MGHLYHAKLLVITRGYIRMLDVKQHKCMQMLDWNYMDLLWFIYVYVFDFQFLGDDHRLWVVGRCHG